MTSLVLVACSGEPAAAPATSVLPRASAPTPTGPSCAHPSSGNCLEYPREHYPTTEGEQRNCAATGGTWSSAACPREGALGDCATTYGSVMVFYASHGALDAAHGQCDAFGWQWFPAAGQLEAPPPAPPPPSPPPPPPEPEPSYQFERPDGFVSYLAPVPESGRNLETYRSERGYGRTDAHAVLLLRFEVLAERDLPTALTVDRAQYAAAGVHITSDEPTTQAGAPGVRLDSLSTTDDGEALRTLQLLVLDGSAFYSVHCGGGAASYRSWRSACESAIDSFRVVHAP